jgi:hypothetical protein
MLLLDRNDSNFFMDYFTRPLDLEIICESPHPASDSFLMKLTQLPCSQYDLFLTEYEKQVQ